MSVTTQPTTFADLYTLVLNQVRSQTSQANTLSQAKRAVNMALQDMHLGSDYSFYWAEREAKLVLQPDYSTGTLAITAGSTSVVGTGSLWDTAGSYGTNNIEVGWKLKVGGSEVVYRVTAIGSDTTLTLDAAYVGSTVTAASYNCWKDEYELASDYLRPVNIQFFDDNREIRLVDRRQLKRALPRNSITGRPKWATQIELGPSGSTALRPRIVIAPPPDQVYAIPYSYITNLLAVDSTGTGLVNMSADTDEPIVPLRYRGAIYHYAMAFIYEHKDDARQQTALQQYAQIMQRILSDVTIGDRRMRIEPAISTYVRHAETPYSGSRTGRRFDTSSGAFDRLE
jgi:hypothetical protein